MSNTPDFRPLEFHDIVEAHKSAAKIILEWKFHYITLGIALSSLCYLVSSKTFYTFSPLFAILAPIIGLVCVINFDANLKLRFIELLSAVFKLSGSMLTIFLLVSATALFVALNPDYVFLLADNFFPNNITNLFPRGETPDLSQVVFRLSMMFTVFLYSFSTQIEKKYFALRFGMNSSESKVLISNIMARNEPLITAITNTTFLVCGMLTIVSPLLAPIWALYSVNVLYYCLKGMFDGGAKCSKRKYSVLHNTPVHNQG